VLLIRLLTCKSVSQQRTTLHLIPNPKLNPELNPKPNTLNPTPRPKPYTLHPTPYTSQQRTTLHYTPRDQGPKCGVGIGINSQKYYIVSFTVLHSEFYVLCVLGH